MLVSQASRILPVHGETIHCQMPAGQLSCSARARTSASTAKLVRTSMCNCVETNCIVKRCSIFSLSRKHAAITRHKRVARTRIRNLELFQNGVTYQALPELTLTWVQRSSLVIIARAEGEAWGRGYGRLRLKSMKLHLKKSMKVHTLDFSTSSGLKCLLLVCITI